MKNNKILIFDTTLRDGEQSPGASMNIGEKVRIATQLEKLGVNIIEAGFPAASMGDFKAVKIISEKLEKSQIAALCRTHLQDITKAWDAIKKAKHPRIHVFIATSDIHMKYKLRMSKNQIIEKAVKAVKYAASFTDNIEFSAEDSSRSDPDFLCQIFNAVIDSGASTINLTDTVGYAVPGEFSKLIKYIIKNTLNIHKAVLSVHCHNDLGLATSNTLAAISSGAGQVEVTINGIGERAGNASLEEVVMSLNTRPNFFQKKTSINTRKIYEISRLVRMITGITIQPNRPIVGANAFSHKAGIHQHGILKNPMTYEIMKPETIGLNKNKLILGKHSGRHAFYAHVKEMGYNLSENELNLIFKKFKLLADKKKKILSDDIEALINEEILRTREVFSLKSLYVSTGTEVDSTATLELKINNKIVNGSTKANGPIDAVFNTISRITNTKSELLRFSISALTSGTDAQGEVTVRLIEHGIIALGRGTSSDIIIASALAYINGLNRLEHLKKENFTIKQESF
ncbi:MAG: 2-isopropylmalate synthase [Desulfobacteraceae bacterium 4572_130]|nr:MAG: 2-isopropylmalate synthase [Desulfobacteraceae bacterium 4572_130]